MAQIVRAAAANFGPPTNACQPGVRAEGTIAALSAVGGCRDACSTEPDGAPGWQNGNRGNTSGMARISRFGREDASTGDCFTHRDQSRLGIKSTLVRHRLAKLDVSLQNA